MWTAKKPHARTDAVFSLDGNSSTFWQTQWCPVALPYPHEIQIDLGQRYFLNGFSYLPRQDNCANGWISQYAFFVSPNGVIYTPPSSTFDPVPWGTALSSGTFNYGLTSYPCGSVPPVPAQVKSFTTTVGRFVRLQGLSEVNGNPTASAAEINLFQTCPGYPAVLIGTPESYYLQPSASLTVKAQVCLDPSTQQGWGVRFMLDGGSAAGGFQIDDFTAPFQATFTGVSAAEHTVDAYIINQSGTIMSGTDAHNGVI